METLDKIDELISSCEKTLKYLEEQRREVVNRLNLNKVKDEQVNERS